MSNGDITSIDESFRKRVNVSGDKVGEKRIEEESSNLGLRAMVEKFKNLQEPLNPISDDHETWAKRKRKLNEDIRKRQRQISEIIIHEIYNYGPESGDISVSSFPNLPEICQKLIDEGVDPSWVSIESIESLDPYLIKYIETMRGYKELTEREIPKAIDGYSGNYPEKYRGIMRVYQDLVEKLRFNLPTYWIDFLKPPSDKKVIGAPKDENRFETGNAPNIDENHGEMLRIRKIMIPANIDDFYSRYLERIKDI